MKVNLREKKIKNGKRSLYLDFYPPIIADGKQTRREFLSLYVYEKPKTETERNHNKETRMLAEHNRATRQLDLQANPHGFVSSRRRKADFLEYFRKFIASKQKLSRSAVVGWEAILRHLTDFSGGSCKFSQIDVLFVERFRDYLLVCESYRFRSGKKTDAPKTSENSKNVKKPEPKTGKLSANTAKSYFERFVSLVRRARQENYLSSDPTAKIEGLKATAPHREFLLIGELQRLAKTPCEIPDKLRRAALFSALTGLRHSDIGNLTWADVRENPNSGTTLNLLIKKTGEHLLLPISDEARALLGEAKPTGEKIFAAFRYDTMTNVYIERWTKAAGVTRRLTFHDFRRTYATAQLAAGTDIYTISQMLGHASIKQTQIYAKLLDEKKREAANKITLK